MGAATAKREKAMTNNAGELLLGAKKISEFLGVSPRQVYRLADEGLIPTFKVGGTLSARRSSLDAWLVRLSGESA